MRGENLLEAFYFFLGETGCRHDDLHAHSQSEQALSCFLFFLLGAFSLSLCSALCSAFSSAFSSALSSAFSTAFSSAFSTALSAPFSSSLSTSLSQSVLFGTFKHAERVTILSESLVIFQALSLGKRCDIS